MVDVQLGRQVAIKVLPDAVAHDAERPARFGREARTLAALNHPNIAQIYGLETSGGTTALVIELVEGPNLTNLPTMTSAALTRSNAILGTAPYMSPEQAQGKALDKRSDIFSFDAVLYEVLAGSRAFPGDSVADVLTALLRDDPRPFKAPLALTEIVTRCLAKDPDRRFQTIQELKTALQQPTHGRDCATASIAVLPFVNLSADPENQYFGDGLAEEIINALAQVDGLKVIARTSAFSFKGKSLDVRQIAGALGVSHVLEGGVRRSGDRVRVTAQLIVAVDGAHAWSRPQRALCAGRMGFGLRTIRRPTRVYPRRTDTLLEFLRLARGCVSARSTAKGDRNTTRGILRIPGPGTGTFASSLAGAAAGSREAANRGLHTREKRYVGEAENGRGGHPRFR